MAPIRFRSRFLHATIYDYVRDQLTQLGWISGPINFGTMPVQLIDYQPDDRMEQIKQNTVAVSLGDYPFDEDEELGAAVGGTRGAPYTIFIDVYMVEQALSQAICDDLRDIFEDQSLFLVDQITQTQTTNLIEIERVEGPVRPSGTAAEQFRRYWRIMTIDTRLYFQT